MVVNSRPDNRDRGGKYILFIITLVLVTDLAILLDIPLLRQALGFLCFTTIPGFLIIHLLKLNEQDFIKKCILSVGLSIALLMFVGLLMNWLYPMIGISRPISFSPLIITLNIIVLILCILAYKTRENFPSLVHIDRNEILSPGVLSLVLILLLSLLGVLLVRFYKNNILLLLLMIAISLIVGLIAFDRGIPKRIYPLAIFMISLALLYHNSLISPYLGGCDIHYEYYAHKLVEMNSHWDPNILSTTYNAMVCVTILPTIYSRLLNIDGVWIYKIFYPLTLSLVPLGLYHVYRSQTNEKTAFLSTFFFISFSTFFGSMLNLPRQQFAELFVVLLMLLIIDKKRDRIQRKMLVIIFSASLIVSHYGTSYIYMFLLLFAWLLPLFVVRIGRSNLTGISIVLFFIMALSWYMYMSNSVTFNTIVNIGNHMYTHVYTDFFNPETMDPNILSAAGISPMVSLGHEISRWLFLVTQVFIAIGAFRLIFLILRRKEIGFDRDYISFSLLTTFFLFMCIILPYLAGFLNMNRIYHITLLFLSPFCIIGGETAFRGIARLFRSGSSNKPVYTRVLVLMVLIPYFLFSTGFIYEVTNDYPGSVALSTEKLKKSEDAVIKNALYSARVPEQSVFGARWLKGKRYGGVVYADQRGRVLTHSSGMVPPGQVYTLTNTTKTMKESYIYLGYPNIVDGTVVGGLDRKTMRLNFWNATELSPLLDNENRIYSNGGSEIYRS